MNGTGGADGFDLGMASPITVKSYRVVSRGKDLAAGRVSLGDLLGPAQGHGKKMPNIRNGQIRSQWRHLNARVNTHNDVLVEWVHFS
jgi:hypothetical protein